MIGDICQQVRCPIHVRYGEEMGLFAMPHSIASLSLISQLRTCKSDPSRPVISQFGSEICRANYSAPSRCRCVPIRLLAPQTVLPNFFLRINLTNFTTSGRSSLVAIRRLWATTSAALVTGLSHLVLSGWVGGFTD